MSLGDHRLKLARQSYYIQKQNKVRDAEGVVPAVLPVMTLCRCVADHPSADAAVRPQPRAAAFGGRGEQHPRVGVAARATTDGCCSMQSPRALMLLCVQAKR